MASKTVKLSEQVAREKRLREELRRDLELRTAELAAAQARVAGLEQTIRQIHESRPYRMASRIWRMKRLTGALWSRSKARQESLGGNADLAGAPRAVVHAEGHADPETPPAKGMADSTHDRKSKAPVHAVRLLGGLDEDQLVRAVQDLERKGRAPSQVLVITDSDAFRALDDYGCRCEFIPPRSDWERVRGTSANYDVFVSSRLLNIASTHGVEILARSELTPGA